MKLFSSLLDLVKVTLLNGNDEQYCDGNRISVAVIERGSNQRCKSKKKPQLPAGGTGIWNTQNLEDKCKKTLFDPDKEFEVQALTETEAPFCPKQVELEILDLNSHQPRYFCSEIQDLPGGYKTGSNWIRHEVKEERCPSN